MQVRKKQETGDGGRETGDGRWKTGGRRQETGDGGREAVGSRQEAGSRRRETGNGRQETGSNKIISGIKAIPWRVYCPPARHRMKRNTFPWRKAGTFSNYNLLFSNILIKTSVPEAGKIPFTTS
jgi:hypothetical protein